MSEKTPRLRPHERPPVNPYIKQYAGQLGAGSQVGVLRDGRAIRLADPVEHGYSVDLEDWQECDIDEVPIIDRQE